MADVLRHYLRSHSRVDGRCSPGDAPLWTGRGGGPRSYRWALKKVHRAADVATALREGRDLPPLPHVTPHTLRHTYISILLLVTGNVLYVMEQVGHEDQDTTNRIYRHLIRQRQQHGSGFDRIVADAREAFGTSAEGRAIVD